MADGTGDVRSPAPETYTPRHLAQKIVASKAALEGERKHVTVLFADLKSSMELVAERDPEEARGLLDPIINLMMEAVHRYEGTVNQVMGDGIMALFGAPLAHEDHALRAAYAALRMQESVRQHAEGARRAAAATVKIRVGLNSGEVVVRAISGDLHVDYTAVGQTTHLAARMEQMADPGAILMTASTFALVEGFVEVKVAGPVTVKGLANPIEVYELIGAGQARTRLQAAAGRGLTRFVGRETELEQLLQVQRLAGVGRGQVVLAVGPAGVGKSRLVFEFSRTLRRQGWLVAEGASVSYGRATSYLPLIDLLKAYFGIQDRDDQHGIREKVTSKLFSLDRGLESHLPALLALLQVPVEEGPWRTIDPEERRQRTLDAVKQLLLRQARAQPLMVIFEDAHWIDRETQAVLDKLVDSIGSAPLLLLMTCRPEYQHQWSTKTYFNHVKLDVLSAANTRTVLDALLGEDPALVPLKQVLLKRGNPFFLEETVRTLVEIGALSGERGRYRLAHLISSIQVPASVQAVLAARIDRLAPEDKRLLQTMAVAGKNVSFILLQAIAQLPDDALRIGLDRLHDAEFVYETGFYPELEYTFKHALTHEVTYAGVLQERRRDLHARIVAAIETLHATRLVEHVEQLAHHALQGGLRERAVRYLRDAGRKAAVQSLSRARAWFEQALDALRDLPETRATLEHAIDVRLELRPVLVQLGEVRTARTLLHEAEPLAERLDDAARRGRVAAFMTNAQTAFGELDEALESGARALAIADRLGDLRLRIVATSYVGSAHDQRGEYERAVELLTRNLATLPPEWVLENFGNAAPASVFDRLVLSWSLGRLGRFAEAAECVAEAMRVAEITQHAYTLGLAHWAAASLYLGQGDWARARTASNDWILTLRTRTVPRFLALGVASSAWALAELGEADEALSRLRECTEIIAGQATRMPMDVNTYNVLGRAYLAVGRLDEAMRCGNRVVQLPEAVRRPGHAATAEVILGEVETQRDQVDIDTAEAHYRRALALAEPRGMRPVVAHCHLGLGKLYRRTERRDRAREHAITAVAMYRDMDLSFRLQQAEAEVKGLG